jgi:pimeloyl-ACP methyl ester carboxylesterase
MITNLVSAFRFISRSSTQLELNSHRKVEIFIQGRLDKPVILCIGGLGTPSLLFDRIIDRLKRDYCFVSFEYSWQLEGSWRGATISDYADDAIEIVDYMGGGCFSIISFCMGGKTAAEICRRYNDRTRRVTFINPNFNNESVTEPHKRLVSLLEYAYRRPDSKNECYDMVNALVGPRGEGELENALARPYTTGPQCLYNFACYAMPFVVEEVATRSLAEYRQKMFFIIDAESELIDERSLTSSLVAVSINPIITGAYGGHYSVYENDKLVNHVVAVSKR